MFQRSGYETKSLIPNVALGLINGIDSALWCYAFATIIFSSVLTPFLPIGLVIVMVGWALVSLFVTATSKIATAMIAIDEQGVIIIGSISTLMIANFGTGAASPEGLATILAVIAITSFATAAGYYVIGSFGFARLLELIPYPVICGFMAGIAWLLFDAAVTITVGHPVSMDIWPILQEDSNLFKLMLSAAGGGVLVFVTNRIGGAWGLPFAFIIILIGFYVTIGVLGETRDSLVAGGWLLNIDMKQSGIGGVLSELSPYHVNTDFIVSVTPQIATIVFLCMLSAAMNLSTIAAVNFDIKVQANDEMKGLSGGNALCALVCCPPGYTDAASTTMYEEFGATSRWMPIASSVVLLILAPMGIGLVGYMPTILVGATIFLFVIQLSNEWMYENVRKFGLTDYLIVCFILGIVIIFGIVEGVLAGLLLTVILFVVRYSMVSAIQSQYTLEVHRSSVERSRLSNLTLKRNGNEALVFTLRGFLFFGTANTIRDVISNSIKEGNCSTILLDLHRVTGIDISALQTFQNIFHLCSAKDIQLFYSNVPMQSLDKIQASEADEHGNEVPRIFSETDFAIEHMEEIILANYSSKTTKGSVHSHLTDILDSEDKAQIILDLMKRIEIDPGEHLFCQGDPDNGLFMLETGSMTAMIDNSFGDDLRVKKFSPGSIIGEISSYSADKRRSATVVAHEKSVLYHLNMIELDPDIPATAEAISAIHEMVALTLSARMEFMNWRLLTAIP
jgi:SulP family sulfate permease